MGFLIRCAFWLSLVLLIIPIDTGDKDGGESVGPIQAAFAASGAFDDLTGLCERRPDVCETGRAAFNTIAARARETVRIATDFIEDEDDTETAIASKEDAADPAMTTGSVSKSN